MGTETRYHNGTPVQPVPIVPNENAYFGSSFRFLKYPLFFYRPLVVLKTKLNIADAHTAHAPTHTERQ